MLTSFRQKPTISIRFNLLQNCSFVTTSEFTEAYRCHPTSELRHRTSEIWYPTFAIRHPRFDIRLIWHPRFDIRHLTSDIRDSTSDIRDSTSDIRHPTSDIRLPRFDIRHLKGWPWCVVPGNKGPRKWGLKGNNADYSGFDNNFIILHYCECVLPRYTPSLGNVQRSCILFRSVRWI